MDKIKGIKEVPKCWRYTQPNFSISRFIPDTEMFANFQQLVQFLESLPSDMYDWANETAEHIKESFHLPTITEDLLSFDKNDNDNLKSCFPDILTAITEKKAITISYIPRNSSKEKQKVVEKTVSPYFLKQYGKGWQLYAKVVGSKRKYDQFPLDRIEDYKDSDVAYEPTDIKFNEELKDVIGFTVTNNKHHVEHIKLLVSEGKYPFLEDSPLHHTQHIIEKRGKDYIIGIDVTRNLELEKQLLLHLDGVTVLEPASLKEQIEDYLKAALRRYTGEDTL
ncbi:MAG: WYL domain-containing protein [Paludibacteraceae bacterium]|nr:WYL domain-containing protein [Paludibacteraceae bacterium]